MRKALGTLKNLTVGDKTRKRYESARKRFYAFLERERLSIPKQAAVLDQLLSDYIEFLWASGEGRGLASDTVAGIQDLSPRLRGNLQATWRLLRTWQVNELPNRAPPLPLVVLEGLIGYGLFQEDYRFSLSLLIGFYGLLRTGELFDVTSQDIAMNGPFSPIVLSLGLTKSGKRAGAAESVTIQVREVQQWVWHWKQAVPPHTPLVPSYYGWRKMFNDALQAMHLQSFQFRPYSLRRGGATFWWQCHANFDKLLMMGRWKAAATAKIYLNEGLSLLAQFKLVPAHLKPFRTVYNQFSPSSLQKLEQTPKRRRNGERGKHKKGVTKGGTMLELGFKYT